MAADPEITTAMAGRVDQLDELLAEMAEVIDLLRQVATHHPDLPAALQAIRIRRAEFVAHAQALATLRDRLTMAGPQLSTTSVVDALDELLRSLPAEVRP